MTGIIKLTFNPFQENTWILFSEEKECWIIDPGNSNPAEDQQLVDAIEKEGLTPVKLLLTHAHIDHILGLEFIKEKYGLKPFMHKNETPILERSESMAAMFGMSFNGTPEVEGYIEPGETLTLGAASFELLFTPGHSPGSITFYNKEEKFAVPGDVIMMNSIGRTDLPFCNHDDLINSIKTKIYGLPDDVMLYTGHGWDSSVGEEKKNNMFVKG